MVKRLAKKAAEVAGEAAREALSSEPVRARAKRTLRNFLRMGTELTGIPLDALIPDELEPSPPPPKAGPNPDDVIDLEEDE